MDDNKSMIVGNEGAQVGIKRKERKKERKKKKSNTRDWRTASIRSRFQVDDEITRSSQASRVKVEAVSGGQICHSAPTFTLVDSEQ